MVQNLKSLGNGLHHAVFNSIMDHLGEMSAAGLAAIEISIRNRNSLENRLAVIKDFFLSADHCAYTIHRTIHAAACPAVEVMNVHFFELTRAIDGLLVM